MRARERVRPAVADLAFADVTGVITHADLEALGTSASTRAVYRDTVAPDFAQRHRREIRDDVRCHVAERIGDFVEKLLGDSLLIDCSARARRLRDAERAVLVDFSNRVTDVSQVRRFLPVAP